ncbi:putative glycosyltransferase YkoT [Stratiformator vulcanicus]|uniref:Putative glycosyltransferase YkoT n=1 Tax=Stratiformator vulcanicus TaxID=2527980 RepID=A0A517QWD5_9PLAN|nr:putative glycosyltransferase YkoT [Stratiformator vulcanicus]
MDRVAVDALNRFSERWLFYRGLVHWAGFRKAAVDYDAPPRFAGSSSYSLTRMFNIGLDAVFSFSLLPLRVSHVFGVICMFRACYALQLSSRLVSRPRKASQCQPVNVVASRS